MSGSPLFAAVSAAFAALVAWLFMFGFRALRRRAVIRRRMSRISNLLASAKTEDAPREERVEELSQLKENWILASLNSRYPLAGGVRTALVCVGAGALCYFGLSQAMQFFGLGAVLSQASSLLIGLGLAWNLGTVLENNRREEFSSRFLVILEDVHRMVTYGISSHQALTSASGVAEEPVKTSLQNILRVADFGVPLGLAVEREGRRVRIGELLMLAAVFSTQSSSGGNLSESIENLAATMRGLKDNRARMKAATSESRVTMVILALVPVGGIALQAMLQPEVVDQLFGESRHLFGIGIALILGGLMVSWMMIRRARR